jgi:hypothetical protein
MEQFASSMFEGTAQTKDTVPTKAPIDEIVKGTVLISPAVSFTEDVEL